jgi:hypothetical protein
MCVLQLCLVGGVTPPPSCGQTCVMAVCRPECCRRMAWHWLHLHKSRSQPQPGVMQHVHSYPAAEVLPVADLSMATSCFTRPMYVTSRSMWADRWTKSMCDFSKLLLLGAEAMITQVVPAVDLKFLESSVAVAVVVNVMAAAVAAHSFT